MSIKTALNGISRKMRELDSACNKLEKEIEKKYNRKVEIAYTPGTKEINVEFDNGNIWEWGTAITFLEKGINAPNDGASYNNR